MMRRALPLVLLSLAAACSDRGQAGSDGTTSDFASRIGTASAPGHPAAGAASTTVATPSAAIEGPRPTTANVFAMQQLGDIGGVNFGPRAGGCTFSEGGKELLIAAGPADRAMGGKGVVRIGGRLVALDTPPGGIAAIKAGTTFTGEGFTVRVAPTGSGQAVMTIAQGSASKQIVGAYVCA